jgi:hypothetical protein
MRKEAFVASFKVLFRKFLVKREEHKNSQPVHFVFGLGSVYGTSPIRRNTASSNHACDLQFVCTGRAEMRRIVKIYLLSKGRCLVKYRLCVQLRDDRLSEPRIWRRQRKKEKKTARNFHKNKDNAGQVFGETLLWTHFSSSRAASRLLRMVSSVLIVALLVSY